MTDALANLRLAYPVQGPEPSDQQIREDASAALATLARTRPEVEVLDVMLRSACAKLSWRSDAAAREWALALVVASTMQTAMEQLRAAATEMTRYGLGANAEEIVP